mmetsp:Transcript_21122/g.74505  ORF Transcript_21122/g.74505 Transcript_21122/m.74505 type:complete len:237 (+) Transcript_21122:2097-2807(+)
MCIAASALLASLSITVVSSLLTAPCTAVFSLPLNRPTTKLYSHDTLPLKWMSNDDRSTVEVSTLRCGLPPTDVSDMPRSIAPPDAFTLIVPWSLACGQCTLRHLKSRLTSSVRPDAVVVIVSGAASATSSAGSWKPLMAMLVRSSVTWPNTGTCRSSFMSGSGMVPDSALLSTGSTAAVMALMPDSSSVTTRPGEASGADSARAAPAVRAHRTITTAARRAISAVGGGERPPARSS